MVKEINMQDLKKAVEGGKVHTIYDNRGEGSVQARRIKGAKWLSVPDAEAGKKLPDDKEAMLVFY